MKSYLCNLILDNSVEGQATIDKVFEDLDGPHNDICQSLDNARYEIGLLLENKDLSWGDYGTICLIIELLNQAYDWLSNNELIDFVYFEVSGVSLNIEFGEENFDVAEALTKLRGKVSPNLAKDVDAVADQLEKDGYI